MKILGLALCACLVGCAALPGLRRPRAYEQDSFDAACARNPAGCAAAFGPEQGVGGTAAVGVAPESGSVAQAMATGVLAASVIASAKLDAAEREKIEQVLKECADAAFAEVMQRRFGGKVPTPEQCNEGQPMSLAMRLGEEMHHAAYACLNDKLGKLIPGRFSIEQRYRYNPRNGRTMLVTKEEEALLRKHGNGDELRDSIAPDLVIHKGDPRYVQQIYDFKFPCSNPRRAPEWRAYPEGHPVAPRSPRLTQRDVYLAMLGQVPARVVPFLGVLP